MYHSKFKESVEQGNDGSKTEHIDYHVGGVLF